MKLVKFSQGQTMVEMVVATGMVALVLVAIVAGIALSVRNSRFSRNKALATRYGQETLEAFRNYRDEVGWGPFKSEVLAGSDQTYCLPQIASSSAELVNFIGACTGETVQNSTGATEFTRSAQTELDLLNDTVKVAVTVSWFEGSRAHQIELSSILNKWEL